MTIPCPACMTVGLPISLTGVPATLFSFLLDSLNAAIAKAETGGTS